MVEHAKEPSKRHAQHTLARDFVELIHGEQEAKDAEARHRMLFGGRSSEEAAVPVTGDVSSSLNPKAPHTNWNNAPSINVTLPTSLIHHQPIARVLYSAGLVSSRAEGHRLAQSQGAYIGSRADGRGKMSDDLAFTPIKLWDPFRTKDYLVDGDLMILRVGKWKVKVVKVVSDEEFERQGLSAPGWKELTEEAESETAKTKKTTKLTQPQQHKVEKAKRQGFTKLENLGLVQRS